jgi:O-succinylbenzoic acid--CoA ligase
MIPWLTQRAAASPQRTALVVEGREISFAALEASARASAARLRAAGLRPGDVLASLLWNGRAFVECLHAAALCGATLLPLNARAAPPELAFVLQDASATLLVHGSGDLAKSAADASRLAGGVPALAVTGGPSASLAPEVPPPGSDGGWAESIPPEGRLAVLYTSGTTGQPKGACLSFGNFLASAGASALHLGASADDRWLACLPLFHVGGLAILSRSVLAGSAVVLHERFDAEAVSRALERDAITHVSLVPTMLRRLLEARGERPAPSTLRCVLVGGGPTPPTLLERARALGFPVAATYGLTEATSQVATQLPHAASLVGEMAAPPLPGIEVRIEGEAGEALPAGQAGEICVRGPTVMTGYLGRPEETARALRGGWLHTGDVGLLDSRGWLRVLDRRQDLVVSGGENVYPTEVEAVLTAHPEVAEAAVAGEPDADLGQRVVAAVVLRPGARCDEAALRAFCRGRLAGYKVPRRLLFLAELPRTSSGKVLRRSLPFDGRRPGASVPG